MFFINFIIINKDVFIKQNGCGPFRKMNSSYIKQILPGHFEDYKKADFPFSKEPRPNLIKDNNPFKGILKDYRYATRTQLFSS